MDDEGRPVREALVFNGTDGPQVVRTTSDEQGRFRVEGLYAGEAYLFVQAEGYRVQGAFVPVGATDARLVLQRVRPGTLGSPVALAPSVLPADEGRQLARQVLVAGLTRPGLTRTPERRRLLGLLARLDGEQALSLCDPAAGETETVRLEMARESLARDVEQGLALLQAVEFPEHRTDLLLEVAAAHAAARPDLARRCLQAAHETFPQIQDARRRAVRAARLGAALLPFDPATGKALLLAARDEIASFRDQASAEDLTAVAACLAEVDLPAALALLNWKDARVYLTIASHIAHDHPDEALGLLGQWGSSGEKTQARLQLAPLLPAARFEQTGDEVRSGHLWEAWPVMIRMCPSAPRERLAEWIEQTRDLLEPPPPEQRGDGPQSTGERETQGLAVLALMARRLGYQEAREIMLRAVLARTRDWTWRHFGRIMPEPEKPEPFRLSQGHLARLVVLLEPQLARRLLPAEVAPDDPGCGMYVAALAGLEPPRAAELLKQMPVGSASLDRAFQQAAGDVAETLMLSPEERETALLTTDRDWRCLPKPGERLLSRW